MHVCRCSALRATRWAAVVLAVLAMAMAAVPVRAAGDEDYKGWFLTLDAALTQPTGLVQQDIEGSAAAYDWFWWTAGTSTDRFSFDTDSDFTGTLRFGYGFGNGLGRLQVSYWGFDDTISGSGDYSFSTYSYSYYSGYYYYNYGEGTGRAENKVQAATLDLDYLRSYAVGKKTTVTWLAGIRSATYEETRDFVGTGESYYRFAYMLEQHKHFETDALGLRLGAAVKFGFTDHFSLEGSSTFSFLQGSTEGNSSVVYTDFFAGQEDLRSAKDDNVRGEMREFDLKACWSYGMMDYFVGYRMETWDGLVVDPLLAMPLDYSPQSRDAISFNSLHAGVTFKFGKN